MTRDTAEDSATRLRKTARYVGRKTQNARSEMQELSEVQAEMQQDAQHRVGRIARGVDMLAQAAFDASNVRCGKCGRKIQIPTNCVQCTLEKGKSMRVKRQRSIRGG